MRYVVIFRPEARDEALDAADYIAEHGSPEIALRWYEGLAGVIASLAQMPASHGYAREHGALPGVELRQVVYKSHRLIFTIRGDEVHVLHILHVARSSLDQIGLDDRGQT